MLVEIFLNKEVIKEIIKKMEVKHSQYYARQNTFYALKRIKERGDIIPLGMSNLGWNAEVNTWIRSSGSWIRYFPAEGRAIASGPRNSLRELLPPQEEVVSWRYIETTQPGWGLYETAEDHLRKEINSAGGVEKVKAASASWINASGLSPEAVRFAHMTVR